jgi:hypothetical protein
VPGDRRRPVPGPGPRPAGLADEAALAALLAADDHVRLWLAEPGGPPVPLSLCVRCPEPGSWTVVLPGIAGFTDPVMAAVITAPAPAGEAPAGRPELLLTTAK